MEIRIKTGSDLLCDYTGAEASVLVKLTAPGHSCGDPLLHDSEAPTGFYRETMWLSRKALEEALKVINALDGAGTSTIAVNSPVVSSALPMPSFPSVQSAPPPVQSGPRGADSAALQRFDRALADLIENPPPSHSEKDEGTLAEIHVRSLVQLHKSVFGDPVSAMAPILKRHLGMDRNRVEILVSAKG